MSKISSLFAAALMLLAANVGKSQTYWEPCNGAPVRGISSIVTGANGELFVTGTGGFYRSSDNGHVWHCISAVLFGDGFTTLGVDSSGHLFAMVWPYGPYRSMNDGYTWSTAYQGLPSDNSLEAIRDVKAFACGNNGLLFVAMQNGVYRSTNTGYSWVRADSGLTDTNVISIAIDRKGVLFAGTYSGMFRSSDSGNIWERLDTMYHYVAAIEVDDSNRIFALALPGGLLRSTNEGFTWDSINRGLTDSILTTIGVGPDGELFLGTWGKGAFHSIDHGNSWTHTSLGALDTTISAIVVTQKGLVFAGTYDSALFFSKDDGVTWQPVGSGILNANMVFALPNGGVLASTDGGTFLSKDEGDTWSKIDSEIENSSLVNFDAAPNGSLFFCGDSGVFRSTDSAKSWKRVFVDSAPWYGQALSLTINSAGHIFISVPYSGPYRSTDNGDSWTLLNTSDLRGQIPTWVICSHDYLFAVTNGYPNGTTIFRSSSEGENWEIARENLFSHINTISLDPQRNLIMGSNGEIYQSTDDGANWQTIDNGLNIGTQSVVALGTDSSGHMLAGVYGIGPPAILESADTGQSWFEFDNGLTYNALSFATTPRGRTFVASAYGVFRSADSATAAVRETEFLPSSTLLSKNSPNPFPQSTAISFTLPEPSYISLRLFDATGREVRRPLASGFFAAGEHTVDFARGTLPAGVYFYRLEAGGQSVTRAMVVE